jgi:hypothetical protein
MTWVAAAIGGSSILGAAASEAAAEKQLQGVREGIQSTEKMFNTSNQQQAPYRGAGYTALSEIARRTGTGTNAVYDPLTGAPTLVQGNDFFTKPFDMEDFKKGMDPGYQFRLQQGQDLARRQGNVGGGLVGGNVMKGLEDYTQKSASDEFMNTFNRNQTEKTNIYNRLASLAGLGQASVGQTTAAGTETGNTLAKLGVAGGNAAAGGLTGAAGAITGGANSYANYQMLQNMTNPASASSTYTPSGPSFGGANYDVAPASTGGIGLQIRT